MKRRHFFEFCDQSWLSPLFRECFNDNMNFIHFLYKPFFRASPLVVSWMHKNRADTVLDLCSAGGNHFSEIIRSARKTNSKIPRFVLSDLYPAEIAWAEIQSRFGKENIGYIPVSVNALHVELENPPRYWTIFTALHHFKSEDVSLFLRQFCEKADGLCIAEVFERNVYCLIMTLLSFPVNLLSPFFAKKKSLKKLFVSFFFPVSALMYTFDGVVSVLRTYTKEEILSLFPDEYRDQFSVEVRSVWWGFAPMKSSLIFITRKTV